MAEITALRIGNSILASIEPQVLAQYATRFQLVNLVRRSVLQDTGDPIQWVYFPVAGLIGVLSETGDGENVEAAIIGSDGVLGAFSACGSRKALARAIVEISGKAWRLPAPAYRELFQASEGLRTAIHKHVELVLAEARQFTTCNALHSADARLCRAILTALDRSGAPASLPLSQASLAQVLGVQRTTVTFTIATLQEAGLIRSRRGGLEVLDRRGVERRACACWATLGYIAQEIENSPHAACRAS